MYTDLHTRATAAPLVRVWCSEVRTYSPEAPRYKTAISFQKLTVQHTVLCCVVGFMTHAWSRVLLEKLVKKFLACYAAHRFVTVCTTPSVHALSPLQFNIIQCTPRSPKCSHSIRSLHQNPVHICVSYVPRVPPIHPTRFDHPNIILFREEYQTLKLLTTQFSPAFCNFHPVRSKHLPQHPVIDQPQPVLFP